MYLFNIILLDDFIFSSGERGGNGGDNDDMLSEQDWYIILSNFFKFNMSSDSMSAISIHSTSDAIIKIKLLN